MKAKTLLVLIASTTLGLAATAATQAAPRTDSTVRYLVQFQGATGVVDPPLNRSLNDVLADPRPGDELLSHSVILDLHHHRIGRTSEMCTMTVKHPVTFDCSLNVLLRNGSELSIHGAINPMHNPWTAPVVGGTGRYAGAHGTVRATSTPGNPPTERWTFTLR
jgi:dirigent-like protein